MSKIVIQQGHVARKTGAIGTYREQEFAKIVGAKLTVEFRKLGHVVSLIGADDDVPVCDIFIALHLDGNLNKTIRGASVGYPSDDPNSASGKLAQAWKRNHQKQGYPAGFHRDNYTEGLRYYYGFRKSSAKYEYLAEHGTSTNPEDEAWLFSHLDACVKAHVDAVGEVVGHPVVPTPEPEPLPVQGEEESMKWLFRIEGDPMIWITDLITKRHVQTESELDDIVYLNKMTGGKMLYVPEAGSTSGSGSYLMVRVLGKTNTWLKNIPVSA